MPLPRNALAGTKAITAPKDTPLADRLMALGGSYVALGRCWSVPAERAAEAWAIILGAFSEAEIIRAAKLKTILPCSKTEFDAEWTLPKLPVPVNTIPREDLKAELTRRGLMETR